MPFPSASMARALLKRGAPLAALAFSALLSACAPEFKVFYLSQAIWRGTALSLRGRTVVADAVAGAARGTTTLVEVGGLLNEPPDSALRVRIQDGRARAAIAALERNGIAPGEIGVEALPPGFEGEPAAALLDKRMVVVVHY